MRKIFFKLVRLIENTVSIVCLLRYQCDNFVHSKGVIHWWFEGPLMIRVSLLFR